MKSRTVFLVSALAAATLLVAWIAWPSGSDDLTMTGMVTTDDVIVSPQVGGQIDSLAVDAGDPVRKGQLIAIIAPGELAADQAFYAHSADAAAAQVAARRADLASAVAQGVEARANLVRDSSTLRRDEAVVGSGGITREELDQARAQVDVDRARVDAAGRQVAAARSALAAARQSRDAASAQVRGADVRLGYTEVRSPISGIVDVRAVTQGEVVNAGQPIVTIVNPNDLWVRADVEESYIDRVRLGDTLTVRLPSGVERKGVVFYRGVDAEYATQHDVSRTRRDIKTFEIRLHVNNSDRRLALGMTAYVILPLGKKGS